MSRRQRQIEYSNTLHIKFEEEAEVEGGRRTEKTAISKSIKEIHISSLNQKKIEEIVKIQSFR
jgi:hypothetical protein